jgi:hypothetical protein
MTDHSPRQGKIRPDTLFLHTTGACEFDPEHLLDVFSDQRQRFAAVLQGFGAADWAAPTRCATWSAHDVVRHLCDGNGIGLAWVSGTDDGALDLAAGFDPRITPRQWPAASAAESPGTVRLVANRTAVLGPVLCGWLHKSPDSVAEHVGRGGTAAVCSVAERWQVGVPSAPVLSWTRFRWEWKVPRPFASAAGGQRSVRKVAERLSPVGTRV